MITVDFDRLKIKPGDCILDIGCGEGRHTARAWEFPGTLCIGADMSHADLLKSKEKLELHEAFLQEINESQLPCFRRPQSPSSPSATSPPQHAPSAPSPSAPSPSQQSPSPPSQSRPSPSSSSSPSLQMSKNSSTWALSSADISTLPFPDQSMDIVICSEVMEHIRDERQALLELHRIVKPGGILAITVPRAWPEKLCWRLSWEYRNTPGGHIRIYQRKELTKKVLTMGFRQIGPHHYAHSLHTPYWWLKCGVGLNHPSKWVDLYHRLLVWDLMKQPMLTRIIERILNPLMGKSVVLYFERIQ